MYLVRMNLAAQLQKRNPRHLSLPGHYAGIGMHPTCFREDYATQTGVECRPELWGISLAFRRISQTQ